MNNTISQSLTETQEALALCERVFARLRDERECADVLNCLHRARINLFRAEATLTYMDRKHDR